MKSFNTRHEVAHCYSAALIRTRNPVIYYNSSLVTSRTPRSVGMIGYAPENFNGSSGKEFFRGSEHGSDNIGLFCCHEGHSCGVWIQIFPFLWQADKFRMSYGLAWGIEKVEERFLVEDVADVDSYSVLCSQARFIFSPHHLLYFPKEGCLQ